tara:strand:+ start:292 stop:531 length:240 start_codon:yes stop_codon:yes gene_type:complete
LLALSPTAPDLGPRKGAFVVLALRLSAARAVHLVGGRFVPQLGAATRATDRLSRLSALWAAQLAQVDGITGNAGALGGF